MENLPLDISLNILSRLPIDSLFHCKRVCKAWRDLARDPRLPYLHLTYRQSRNNPCLILLDNSTSTSPHLYLVDNCGELNGDEVVKRINTPFNYRWLSSVLYCNGLLCLSYTESHGSFVYYPICIYNPFTEEVTSLPDQTMIYFSYKVAYGFGFHPRTKEYKVVRILERDCMIHNYNLEASELSLEQSVEVFTIGTNVWKLVKGINPFWLRMQPSEALVNGVLHWLAQAKLVHTQIIVAFDLLDEEFRQIPSPLCRFDEVNSNIVVLGGCLSVVVYNTWDKFDIWLMKDYGVKESWTKEFTIVRPDVPAIYGYSRPLCLLKNGKILIKHLDRELLSYDPETKSYKNIKVGKLPNAFTVVPLVESILSALD